MTATLGGHLLEGTHVVLEPIGVGHALALYSAADPSCLTYHPMRPSEWSVMGFAKYIEAMLAEPNRASYLVRWKQDSSVVGTTSFLDIRQAHLGVEIGATWIGSLWRGTAVNPEMKLLLFQLAFDSWGAHRVQLKCDGRNIQSQRAIEKLGAVREGVLRKHLVLSDGFVRDTVMYSVTTAEWPTVKNGLVERLAAFENRTGAPTGSA